MWEDLLILIYCIYFIPLNYLLTFQPLHTRVPRASGERSVYIYKFHTTVHYKVGKKFGIKNLQLQFTYTKPALDDKFDRGHLIYQVVLKGSVLIFKRVPDLALDISERSGI